MAVHLTREESVFRNELIFTPDAKAVNLDNTLTNLFMQIRYDGCRVKSKVGREHTLDSLYGYMCACERDGTMSGVTENKEAISFKTATSGKDSARSHFETALSE